MPQRSFWAQQHPVSITWRYAVDLTRPSTPPRLRTFVQDQEGGLLADVSVAVPPTLIDDSVPGIINAGWCSYLYGDVETALRIDVQRDSRLWWDHADHIQ